MGTPAENLRHDGARRSGRPRLGPPAGHPVRIIEDDVPVDPGETWRTLHHELGRLHLVTLATSSGTVAQRSALTPGHKTILAALDVPEPPRFVDFTPASAWA